MKKIANLIIVVYFLSSCSSYNTKPVSNQSDNSITFYCKLYATQKWNLDYSFYHEYQTQQQTLHNIERLVNIRQEMEKHCKGYDVGSIFYEIQQAAKRGVKPDWLY